MYNKVSPLEEFLFKKETWDDGYNYPFEYNYNSSINTNTQCNCNCNYNYWYLHHPTIKKEGMLLSVKKSEKVIRKDFF